MKTDDLITLMTQDAPAGMRYGRALALALGAGIAVSAVLLVGTVGLRHNMASVFETARVLFKIAVTLVLAVFAARLAMRVGRPGAETRRPALLLVVPVLMVAIAVIAELVALPSDAWGASLIGRNALFCLFFVPVLSLAPLAGLFWALKKGRRKIRRQPVLRPGLPQAPSPQRFMHGTAPTTVHCSSSSGTRSPSPA